MGAVDGIGMSDCFWIQRWVRVKPSSLGECAMGIWNGVMTSEFLEIPVTVIFNPPSDGLEVWYGTGVTNKDWPKNQRQFKTNIGAVLVVNQTIRSDGKHHIAFRGSGNPMGPLAEAIGALNAVIKGNERFSARRASPAANLKSNPPWQSFHVCCHPPRSSHLNPIFRGDAWPWIETRFLDGRGMGFSLLVMWFAGLLLDPLGEWRRMRPGFKWPLFIDFGIREISSPLHRKAWW